MAPDPTPSLLPSSAMSEPLAHPLAPYLRLLRAPRRLRCPACDALQLEAEDSEPEEDLMCQSCGWANRRRDWQRA